MNKSLLHISLVLILLLANLGQAISAGAALFCSEPPSQAQVIDNADSKFKNTDSLSIQANIQASSPGNSQVETQTEADCCQDCCDSTCVCIANSVQTTAFAQARLAERVSSCSPTTLTVLEQKPIWRNSTVYRPPILLS